MLHSWLGAIFDTAPGGNPPALRRGLPWPGSCEVCRTWSVTACCSSCSSLFSGDRPRCLRCAEPLAGSTDQSDNPARICLSCHQNMPVFAKACVAYDYAFPWDDLIQQLKFAGRTELASPLGNALAASVLAHHKGRDSARAGTPADIVVPMPLTPARLGQRGYNQALLLAKRVAHLVNVPLDRSALLRPIEKPHQADLTRAQRTTNLKGVFMVDPAARPRLQGLRVALVDDVMTTGSTANEASRELLRAGAREVVIWAVARTAAR